MSVMSSAERSACCNLPPNIGVHPSLETVAPVGLSPAPGLPRPDLPRPPRRARPIPATRSTSRVLDGSAGAGRRSDTPQGIGRPVLVAVL
jgi:hypothetical protein